MSSALKKAILETKNHSGCLWGNIRRRLFIAVAFVTLSQIGVIHVANAQPYVIIDGEDANMSPLANPFPFTAKLIDSGKVFDIVEHGHWHVDPWVSDSTVVNYTQHSIGFHAIAAPDNGNVADRGELVVVRASDSYSPTFGRRSYLRYKFYIDPKSEAPDNWTLMTQVWQRNDCYSPPFAIYLRENAGSNIILDFKVLDNHSVIGEGCNVINNPVTIWSKTVSKGQWYQLILQLQPSFNGDGVAGQIAIWIDKSSTQSPDKVWYSDWGYKPTPGVLPHMETTFDVRVGIYRRKQPRVFSIFFDDIRFGPTADSVDY